MKTLTTAERASFDKRLVHERALADINLVYSGAVAEYRFNPPRRWKFDYAIPHIFLAIEVEGGVWKKGRHVRGKGFIADMEKYNTAAMMGWVVIRVTPEQVLKGHVLKWLSHEPAPEAI